MRFSSWGKRGRVGRAFLRIGTRPPVIIGGRTASPEACPPASDAAARGPGPALLVVVLAVLPFLNSLGNAFVYDDVAVVRDNPLIRGLAGIPRLFRENYWAPLDQSNLYRPITIVSYAVNWTLTGAEPAGFHLINVALHALVSWQVLALARALGAALRPALAAAVLFAVHPVHVEAVTGIVGRAELLAAAFALAALLNHVRGEQDRGPGRALAATAAAALALFSKEAAAGVLAAMLAFDLAGWREGRRPRLLPWLGLIAAAAGYAAARIAVLGEEAAFATPRLTRLDNVLAGEGPATRLLTAAALLARSAGLMLWPARLSADYSYAEILPFRTAASPLPALGLLLWAALAALLVVAVLRGWRAAAAAVALFLGTHFIVSNSVVLIGTIYAERLLYLPSSGLALLLACAARPVCRRRGFVAAVAALAAAGTFRSAARNLDWRDQRTLFEVTAETAPRSVRAHVYLAQERNAAGDRPAAEQSFRRALSLAPQEAFTWNALAKFYGTRNVEAATGALERAIALEPAFAEAHYNLGATHVWTGRYEEAIPALEEALRHKPYYPDAWLSLGEAYLALGRTAPARDALARARAARPDRSAVRYAWARLLAAEGRRDEATAELEALCRMADPPPGAFLELAQALAASGRLAAAEQVLVRAEAAGGPGADLEIARGNLRLLAGDRSGARAAFRRALELAPDSAFARRRLAELAGEPAP